MRTVLSLTSRSRCLLVVDNAKCNHKVVACCLRRALKAERELPACCMQTKSTDLCFRGDAIGSCEENFGSSLNGFDEDI